MQRLLSSILAVAFAAGLGTSAFAATGKAPMASGKPAAMAKCAKGETWVKGYTKKSGTKVKGYCKKSTKKGSM